MLVTLNDVLIPAKKGKYAVGLFNAVNLELARGIIAAEEETGSPVIMGTAEVLFPYGPLDEVSYYLIPMAKKAKVPVVIHLVHGRRKETCLKALKLGFSSVMYDGSTLSLEENLENTAKTVRLAEAFGASVEAELGHVGGEEGNSDGSGGSVYTKPEDAAYFAEMTGADALGVSIGTVHGRYREKPNLNIPLLKEIHRRVSIPLVLHGGSGLSDQDFKDCIAGGISKINIYTEIAEAARRVFIEDAVKLGYFDLMQKSKRAMRAVAAEKIKLFGSQGKAPALSEPGTPPQKTGE